MPITSADLAALLNDKVINDAFMIARSNRTGILSTIGIGAPRQAYDGYKMGWLDMRVDATSSTTTAQALAAATTIGRITVNLLFLYIAFTGCNTLPANAESVDGLWNCDRQHPSA